MDDRDSFYYDDPDSNCAGRTGFTAGDRYTFHDNFERWPAGHFCRSRFHRVQIARRAVPLHRVPDSTLAGEWRSRRRRPAAPGARVAPRWNWESRCLDGRRAPPRSADNAYQRGTPASARAGERAGAARLRRGVSGRSGEMEAFPELLECFTINSGTGTLQLVSDRGRHPTLWRHLRFDGAFLASREVSP